MAWSNIGGGGENVKPEVDIQTPLIEDIKESLVGKATGANATADTILEGYSAYVGQELVVGTYNPHGLYVWKKYEYESSTVGDFVDYVVSDTETEYPDGDVQDGYYYEKVSGNAIAQQLKNTIMKDRGYTKYAEDSVIPAEDEPLSTSNLSFSHSLGEVPKAFVIVAEEFGNTTITTNQYSQVYLLVCINELNQVQECGGLRYLCNNGNTLVSISGVFARLFSQTVINIYNGSGGSHRATFTAGTKYTIITMA